MNSLVKICRQITILAILLILSGCAASSTFSPYPRQIQPLVNSLSTRTTIDLQQCLLAECTGKDRILYTMERGRYAQVVGNSVVSMADFAAAMDKIRENDAKALLSASDFGAQVAAAVVNDNAIPYQGEGYERVLLHHYQALNYLKKKDLDGAGVEVRRANAEQSDSLTRFEKELDAAEEEATRNRIKNNSSRINTQYAQMDEVAGTVKNSFQNAYTFYVSGFIYELLQQPNDAYIDYKKALEIFPENSYLQKDVLRLAARLGMGEELDELKQRFPRGDGWLSDDHGSGTGELVVLFEDGFVPQKHEVKIPLPAGKAGIVAIAFPIYQERWSAPMPLRILTGSELIGSTEPICDVRALAVKALKEKAPVIATRQIIRAITKGASAAEAKKQMGDLGQFAAIVWNMISENADLRSWLTLPANAQILRATLPAGRYPLSLQHPMAGTVTHTEVDIPANGKTVLHVVRTGQQMYTTVTTF